jgi:hypothetical protein
MVARTFGVAMGASEVQAVSYNHDGMQPRPCTLDCGRRCTSEQGHTTINTRVTCVYDVHAVHETPFTTH